jgi:flagellar basal body-associated protein FliL
VRRILKPKLLLPIALLVALGAAYKFALAEPAAEAKPKVEGQVYVLPKEFLLNLTGERYAKLNVALVIEGEEPIQPEGHGTPPEGFGPLPQEAVVRDIVTDTLTDRPATELVDREARRRIKHQLKKAIERQTDVPVREVLLTDVAIQ